MYNVHKRVHALKYQAIICPDGIVLHAYEPGEGRRQNWIMYSRSSLDKQLEAVVEVNGVQFCIYGDSGYKHRIYMQVPFQGSHIPVAEAAFNTAMSICFVTVEWISMEVKLYSTTVDLRQKCVFQSTCWLPLPDWCSFNEHLDLFLGKKGFKVLQVTISFARNVLELKGLILAPMVHATRPVQSP